MAAFVLAALIILPGVLQAVVGIKVAWREWHGFKQAYRRISRVRMEREAL